MQMMVSHTTSLAGPSVAAKSGKATALVVFLHGYGSNGDDLISLAPYWADLLPDAAFVSPNAPFPCEANPWGGFQWFGLDGTQAAAEILNGWLDVELAARGLDESRLALVGFSQGTMMSLHVGMRRAQPVAGIVGYSGRLIAPDLLKGEIKSRPPVLLVHGKADPVVPFESLAAAEQALRAEGVPVETLARPRLPHSIDQEGLQRGGLFLREKLG
jgi:phospholipase/carboxylesterase